MAEEEELRCPGSVIRCCKMTNYHPFILEVSVTLISNTDNSLSLRLLSLSLSLSLN